MEAHTVKGYEPFSEEDMIEKFKVDKERRESERIKTNARPTSMRRADGEVSQIMNYQTTLFLKRKYPEVYDSIIKVMEERIVSNPPEFQKKVYPQVTDNLAQVLLTDVHLDKRSVENKSIKKKSKEIIEGTKRLLEKIDLFSPQELLFVNLGDYLNTSENYTTRRDTPQQNNIDEIDAWKYGIDLQADLLLLLSEYAPVTAKFVQGNHEGNLLQHLQSVMKYYFQNNPNIKIDENTDLKQYAEWGINLFGYHHGDKLKRKDLASIMINEKKGKKHKNMEWFLGHRHHRSTENFQNTLLHTLDQSGDFCEWEKKYGRDSNNPAITSFIHSKKHGRIAELTERV